MFAFILTDLLQSNSFLFGGAGTDVGEIASSTISFEEFQQKVEELSYQFALNSGQNPSSLDLEGIRQQAWQQLIVENVFTPQYEELGVSVTDDEMVEMVQGNNIHPFVRQAFTDPQTGIFNKEQLMGYLQQLGSLPDQNKAAWINFENSLRPQRALTKYENLFGLTNYATKYEAKDEYRKNNSTASIDFLYVPFFSVPDSTVAVSDAEMMSYLNGHEEEYQREETKNIDYVVFDIQPSAEDSSIVKDEVADLSDGLMTATNDSIFASINSDGYAPYNSYNANTLPAQLDGITEVGYVTSPTLVGNTYSIYKLSDIREGDEYFLKASHILFKWEDDSDEAKAAARKQGDRILREIKRGSDFAEMARIHGTDGTSSRGGDLGWFGENSSFVQEFKDACFNYRGAGLLSRLVETEFGFHIIKVTEAKTNQEFKVAKIEKELFVSDETLNGIYRNADMFALESKSYTDFKEKAQEKGYTVQRANRLNKNDKRVGVIQDARNITFWLFNKASAGSVSEVFELDNKYVVAVQTGYQEEGIASLSEVKNEISKKVRDQKKAASIISQLEGLDGSLEDMQATYGDQARVNSADITLSTVSIPNVGYAPEAVGLAFALEEGEKTAPFKVDNGVLVLVLNSKSQAQELEDYGDYISTVLDSRRSFRRREEPFVDQNIYDAVIEFAEIEDNRYKFF